MNLEDDFRDYSLQCYLITKLEPATGASQEDSRTPCGSASQECDCAHRPLYWAAGTDVRNKGILGLLLKKKETHYILALL